MQSVDEQFTGRAFSIQRPRVACNLVAPICVVALDMFSEAVFVNLGKIIHINII